MIWLRCYNCWHLTGYAGPKESVNCMQCNAILFTGALPMKMIQGANQQSEEHESLLHGLRAFLAKNAEIYEGVSEYIANETARHKPDAIYYRRGPAYMTQPIIYEVLTHNSVMDENTIGRCRLFAETAQNRLSQFYIVILESHDIKDKKDLVEKTLKENGIISAEILILNTENPK